MQRFSIIDKVINVIGASALGIMLLASAVNIISAWTTGRRYGQIEELVLSAFVWVTYIGMGTLYSHGEHIKVEFLVQMLPAPAQKVLAVFHDVVVFLCSAVVGYYVLLLIRRAADIGMSTATLRISYVLIDLSLLLGFGYILIDLTYRLIKLVWKHLLGRDGEKEDAK